MNNSDSLKKSPDDSSKLSSTETSSYTVTSGHLPGLDLVTPYRFSMSVLVVLALVLGVASAYLDARYMIGAILLIVASLTLFTRPFAGLIIYTITFFLRPGEIFPSLEPLHIERMIGIFVLLSMFIGKKLQGKKVTMLNSPLAWAILAFTVAMVLTLPGSFWPSQTRWRVTDFLKVVAFFVLISNLVDSDKRFRIFTMTYVIMIIYISLDSLKGYYSGELVFAQGIERVAGGTSAGGDPNTLANTMDLCLPFLIFILLYASTIWRQLTLLPAMGAMGWTTLISGSRSGFLGLAVMGFGIWLTSSRKLFYASISLAFAVLIWFALPEQYQTRYASILTSAEEPDASTKGRYEAWEAGWAMFVDHPILGVGSGAFGTAHADAYSPKFRRSYLKAHNLYVQLSAEMGLIGILTFGTLVYLIFRTNVLIRRRLRRISHKRDFLYAVSLAMTVATATLMFTGIFGHSLYRINWYLYAGMTAALYEIVRRRAEGVTDSE